MCPPGPAPATVPGAAAAPPRPPDAPAPVRPAGPPGPPTIDATCPCSPPALESINAWGGVAVPRAIRASAANAHDDLHRGPAAFGAPQGSQNVLRLRGPRLLRGGDLAAQPGGPRAHQAAPAGAGGCLAAGAGHHHRGRARHAAACACPDRALRHAVGRWRGFGLPRRAERRYPVLSLDHVGLLDRGRGGGGRAAVLVPAL